MASFRNMTANATATDDNPPNWNSSPEWKLPSWGEPVLVASILVISMFLTRRRNFKILGKSWKTSYNALLDNPDSARSSDELLRYDQDSDCGSEDTLTASKHPNKRRNCCCVPITTPNSSRFSHHLHSRILQKFPFLMEMFYWILTYAFYRGSKIASQNIFSKTGIWDVAQENALRILDFEQFSWASFLFPAHEREVQQYFMKHHQTILTFLNRFYSLIHIPGTVGFIAWYYHVAPTFPTFATVRRTLTLTNLTAFAIFTIYPCMPPRLLPAEYGFLDSVRHDNAQSVWMSGSYVNLLAAMPSMHFGYSFVIGCTLLYHSGIFRRTLERGEQRKSAFWKSWYAFLAIGYPITVLVTIVATANHYFMDVLVAVLVAGVAFLCNKIFLVFLPLEDLLLWALRLEKPVPSTGERGRTKGTYKPV